MQLSCCCETHFVGGKIKKTRGVIFGLLGCEQSGKRRGEAVSVFLHS